MNCPFVLRELNLADTNPPVSWVVQGRNVDLTRRSRRGDFDCRRKCRPGSGSFPPAEEKWG